MLRTPLVHTDFFPQCSPAFLKTIRLVRVVHVLIFLGRLMTFIIYSQTYQCWVSICMFCKWVRRKVLVEKEGREYFNRPEKLQVQSRRGVEQPCLCLFSSCLVFVHSERSCPCTHARQRRKIISLRASGSNEQTSAGINQYVFWVQKLRNSRRLK